MSNNALPFYLFNLYPSPGLGQEETGEGNNIYTKFSAIQTDTVQRHLLYTISKQQQGGSVQLVQVKSKNHHTQGLSPVDDDDDVDDSTGSRVELVSTGGVQTNSRLWCCTLPLQLFGGRCAGPQPYTLLAIGGGCPRPSSKESMRSSCPLPTSYNSTIPSFPLGVGMRATLHTSYPLSTKYTCTDATTHLRRLLLLFASSFHLQQPSSWNQTAVATF